MPRKERRQELNDQPDAHARPHAAHDLDADIAFALQKPQIRLHGPAAFAERFHQVGHGNIERPAGAVGAVGQLRELAGATTRAVGQVSVVLDPRGHLRHVSAGVRRRRGLRALIEREAVTGLKGASSALFVARRLRRSRGLKVREIAASRFGLAAVAASAAFRPEVRPLSVYGNIAWAFSPCMLEKTRLNSEHTIVSQVSLAFATELCNIGIGKRH